MRPIDQQLLDAAWDGEEDKVRSLLRQGANIEAVDSDGDTPLHNASWKGHDKVVKLSLDEGAEVNAVNNIGSTPLHDASLYGRDKLVKLLLDEGADMNAVNNNGNTPLDEAKSRNHQTVVKLLEDVQAGRIVPAYHAKKAADEAKARAEAEAKRFAEEKKATAAAAEKVRAEAEAKRIAEQRVAAMIAAAAAAETEEESQANSKRKAGEADNSLGNQQETEKDEGGQRTKNQADLTEEDIQFIRQGREIFASTSPTSPITPKERSALTVLASNLVDIERSLESVRGLPESLVLGPPEAKIYFDMFTSAFERSYVAAMALSSGAVKVRLDLKDSALGALLNSADRAAEEKGSALGELLGAAGWAAEKSNVPFAGYISIFSTIVMYQRRTRKKNMFWAFQEFFGGGSQGRDHYLLTYRRLAEEICLRIDYSQYSTSSNIEDVAKFRRQVKDQVKKIVNCVRKHLRKVHLDALENLQPVEAKAMTDLSKVTEEVLRLYREDQDRFDTLKAGSEYEKTKYLLQTVHDMEYSAVDEGLTKSHADSQCDSTTRQGEAMLQSSDSSRLRILEEQASMLKKQNENLKKDVSDNSMLRDQVEKQAKRIAKLEKKIQRDEEERISCGGLDQIQDKLLGKSKFPKSRSQAEAEGGARAAQEQALAMYGEEINEIRGQLDALSIDNFISNRKLSRGETFEFIRTCMRKGGIEVDSNGSFFFQGRIHLIGNVSGRFSQNKSPWKGKKWIKMEDKYNGAESVMYWFDKNKLSFIYEKNKHAVLHQLFPIELAVHPNRESKQSKPSAQESNREELFDLTPNLR